MNEKSVFLAALEIKDVTDRSKYLNLACKDDPELRGRVEELLIEHERSGEFLDIPALEQLANADSSGTEATITTHGGEREREPIDFSFLEPSDEPDSLGRLAHYEIRHVLGRGGCGIVLKGFDERLERVVAIKIMSPDLAATSPARKRFLREARATAAVRHVNVVNIHAVDEHPLPFLVMEYVDGPTLQQKLNAIGPLELRDVLEIGQQIAAGLAAAHAKGLIHRDVKPANILLENGGNQVKITDFGLARSADDASITQSGVISGTPLYMSPEQAQGHEIDARSDLFSLGSVLYVMSCGRPPFRAATTLAVLKRVVDESPRPIRQIIPEVPQWLTQIIEILHAKDPDRRFATAQQVADLLAQCLSQLERNEPIVLPPEIAALARDPDEEPIAAAADPVAPVGRRWNGRLAVAAILLLAFVVGFAVSELTGVSQVSAALFGLFGAPQAVVEQQPVQGVAAASPADQVVPFAELVSLDRQPSHFADGDWLGYYRQEKNGEFVQAKTGNSFLVFGDPAWTDVDISVEMQVTAGIEGGHLVFRSNYDGSDCYFFYFIIPEQKAYLIRRTPQGGSFAAEPVPFECAAGQWYQLAVKAVGKRIQCFIDGRKYFDVDSSGLPEKGRIGLVTFASAVKWRNLTVTDPQGKPLWEGFPDVSGGPWGPAQLTDREMAEYALKLGGVVGVNDQPAEIKERAQLPDGDLRLTELRLESLPKLPLGACNRFRASRHLKSLAVTYSSHIDDEAVANFQNNLELGFVNISGTQVTGKGLRSFRNCAKLHTLWALNSAPLHDADVNELPNCMPNLIHLFLNGASLTDAGFAGELKSLKGLVLQGTKLTDDGLKNLAGQSTLVEITLADTAVTDAGLASLESCPQLKNVDVSHTQVTSAGIERFRAALPLCQVRHDGITVSEPTGNDYDDIAVGEWVPLLRTKAELDQLVAEKRFVFDGQQGRAPVVAWEEGAVRLTAGGLYFPEFKAQDMLFRAKVKKVDGFHVDLALRRDKELIGVCYNGDGLFALGRSRGGWKDLSSVRMAYPPTDYFELALALIGNKVLVYVDGRLIIAAENDRPVDDEAGPGSPCIRASVWSGIATGLFTELEAMDLGGLPHAVADMTRDREIAEYVLSQGKMLKFAGHDEVFRPGAELPPGSLRLTELLLGGEPPIPISDLPKLTGAAHLTLLRLDSRGVTDEHLQPFQDCRNLEVIGVAHSQVTGDGLRQLKNCQKLRVFWLNETDFDDEDLKALAEFPQTTLVAAAGTKIGNEGAKTFSQLKRLSQCTLDKTAIDDDGLQAFENHPAITWLDLNHTNVTDAGLRHLENCPKLVAVNIDQTLVTPAGIERLQKALPKCRISGKTRPPSEKNKSD